MVKRTEIINLANSILHHKSKYYSGDPEISDAAYDTLEEKLRLLDPENPVLHFVGSPEGGKINHDPPMLSCQKGKSVQEVFKWAKKYELFVGYKIDGLSLSLVYDNGRLITAATRGNGLSGDDETLRAMKIDVIPRSIPHKDRVNIRGELFMTISEFNRINNLDPSSVYTSPRNLAVGTLKAARKDLSILETRSLSFYAFDLIGLKDEPTLQEKSVLLKSWNFQVSDFEVIKGNNIESITFIHSKVAKERDSLDFEIDGIVYKYNDPLIREKSGSTEHHPKWQIALKFESKGEITKIKSITWQVGRSGVLTPVAELEPIEVAGATISRATVHNAEILETLDVSVGDDVFLIRAGDVIPKIEEVIIKGPNNADLPMICPSCKNQLTRSGVNLVCTGEVCRDRDLASIRHWVGITNIKGLGVKSIEKLYDLKVISHYADLYNSKIATVDKLVNILGKNGEKVHQEIERTRNLPFSIFLSALGIEFLGKKMGKILASHYNSIEELQNTSIDKLVEIENISDTTAEYILQGINDQHTANRVLQQNVTIVYSKEKIEISAESKTSPFFNKKVYVTGKIQGFNKKQIQELIESKGLIWSKSISKNLDYLVIGEKAGEKKLEKARTSNVPILPWDEFINQLQ